MGFTYADWLATVDAFVSDVEVVVVKRSTSGVDRLSPNARTRNDYRATPAVKVTWGLEVTQGSVNLTEYLEGTGQATTYSRKADAVDAGLMVPGVLRLLLGEDYWAALGEDADAPGDALVRLVDLRPGVRL